MINRTSLTLIWHKRGVIERAFALLGLCLPRVTMLLFCSNNQRILCVMACVLNNWCLTMMETERYVGQKPIIVFKYG